MKKNEIGDTYISLVDVLSKLWSERKIIRKFIFLFFLLGVIYSLLLTNIYKASSTFYPHYEKVDGNPTISNLAGLAGINLSNNDLSSDVPTSLYPNLINSAPFKNKILNQEVIFKNKKITYRQYLLTKKTFFSFNILSFISGFFNKNSINSNLKDNNYIMLNYEDYSLHKDLNDIIGIEVNEKDGYIKLTVKDEIASISAEIAKSAEETLQESIINFKLKNIKSVYSFTLDQLESSKKSFYILQDSLANFKDRNKNIRSDLFLNKLNRLETEYNIASSVYNELASSKEKVAIDVQKNTPIFTIIDPVTLPLEKSYPVRSQIVLFFTFSGFILISGWVLIKDVLIKIRNGFKKIS